MKVPHSWLQSQFADTLPDPETMAELFTFRCFEVEGIEVIDGDPVYDLKVLPDRAHYALSWNGIAYEVSAALQKERKYGPYQFNVKEVAVGNAEKPSIKVEDSGFCDQYLGRTVLGLTNQSTPEFLVSALRKMGQRSINPIVDAANYAMFISGQPLHAFDADKIVGKITVRKAKEGETIVTLDGKEVVLTAQDSVIADDEGALAIAGIKGGKKAEVTTETKNVVLEAAHFNSVAVRRTSGRVQIKNDSSKRFENEIPPQFASVGMMVLSAILSDLCPQASFGEIVTVGEKLVTKEVPIKMSVSYLCESLGIKLEAGLITSLLAKLDFKAVLDGDTLTITVPYFRKYDVVISEDVIEEVGRLYGYENIVAKLPPSVSPIKLNPVFVGREAIRSELINAGFSETILYTLGSEGYYETAYPVASDKGVLRTTLLKHIERSVKENTKNADLLQASVIKQFEIGKVFLQEGEVLMLAVAVGFAKKIKGQTPKAEVEKIATVLGLPTDRVVEQGLIAFAEWPIETLVANYGEKFSNYAKVGFAVSPKVEYKPLSPYPFAVRDVAVFVPSTVPKDDVSGIVERNAGSLCVSFRLFDVFEKDGQVSYAFRLVFQANDRTLTEQEISAPVEAIYQAFRDKGWVIR